MREQERRPSLEEAARLARVVAGALAAGVVVLAGAAAWRYFASTAAEPSPAQLKLANALTTAAMALTVGAAVGSEWVWRLLASGPEERPDRLLPAFVVRAALREAPALAGAVAALMAAEDGVLRAYPAYWVDLVPAGLFLAFLAAHWPTAERLAAESAEARERRRVLGPKPH